MTNVFRRLLPWTGLLALLLLVATLLYRQWVFGAAHFAYTFGRTPDQALPTVQTPQPGVDLATTTTNDFPEFLGSGRHAAVEGVALDQNWLEHPPRLLWRHPIGAGWSAFSIVNDFAVTMEQRGEQEQVTCYDVVSGRHRWSTDWNTRFSILGIDRHNLEQPGFIWSLSSDPQRNRGRLL